MNKEELLNKIQKLQALVDRGVGGEKENAEKLLNEIIEKHNISIDELNDNKISSHYIRLNPKKEHFYNDITCLAVLKFEYEEKIKVDGMQGQKMAVNCTSEIFFDIVAYIDIVYGSYRVELEKFNIAFIYKNNLCYRNKDYDVSDPKLEEAAQKSMDAIMQYGDAVPKAEINKLIKN